VLLHVEPYLIHSGVLLANNVSLAMLAPGTSIGVPLPLVSAAEVGIGPRIELLRTVQCRCLHNQIPVGNLMIALVDSELG